MLLGVARRAARISASAVSMRAAHTASGSTAATTAAATTPVAHVSTSISHGSAVAWRRLALLGLGGFGLASAVAASSSSAASGDSPSCSASSSSLLSAAPCAAAAASWQPLSHAKVYKLLSSPVEQIMNIKRGVVREMHINQYAANAVIEDTLSVVPSAAAPQGGLLLGVFDGHSGKDASRWCAEELLPYLQYYRWSNRTDELVHKRAFVESDHHFLDLAIRDKRMQAGLSGACVNVAHILGRTVRTANAGDCRTIVGRRVARKADPSGAVLPAGAPAHTYQAVELTTDHQIDTNPLERERLLRDHPDEEDIIRKNRVKGRLQPTRGMGDGFYKRREFYDARRLNKPYAHWTPPYTTAEPDITSYQLQDDDEFIVMASDGLFQDMHSQQVVEAVGDWLQLHAAEQHRVATGGLSSRFTSSPAPEYTPNASTFLIRAALKHASEHAIGRRRNENENLSWILQVHPDQKRNVHDDITVIVTMLDPAAKFPSDAPATNANSSGPPAPPTLQRALSLHLKTPHQTLLQPGLPFNNGITPIRIAPVQGLPGAGAANTAAATNAQSSNMFTAEPPTIKSNL